MVAGAGECPLHTPMHTDEDDKVAGGCLNLPPRRLTHNNFDIEEPRTDAVAVLLAHSGWQTNSTKPTDKRQPVADSQCSTPSMMVGTMHRSAVAHNCDLTTNFQSTSRTYEQAKHKMFAVGHRIEKVECSSLLSSGRRHTKGGLSCPGAISTHPPQYWVMLPPWQLLCPDGSADRDIRPVGTNDKMLRLRPCNAVSCLPVRGRDTTGGSVLYAAPHAQVAAAD